MDLGNSQVAQSRPFFSICIPAFNPEEYFEECLLSINRQSFTDYELLVLDDGSDIEITADSIARVSGIPFEKIEVFRVANGGPYAARVLLTHYARGEVIITMDSDDAFLDEMALEKIHSAFIRSNADFVVFNMSRVQESKQGVIDYSNCMSSTTNEIDLSRYKRAFAITHSYNNLSTKAVKKRVIADPPEITSRITMGEDRLRTIALIKNATSMSIVDEPLYFYRRTEGSITESPYRLEYYRDICIVESEILTLRDSFNFTLQAWANNFLRVTTDALRSIQYNENMSRSNRIEAYAEMRNEKVCKLALNYLSDARLSRYKRIQLNLFSARRFRLLDALLQTRQVLSSARSCFSAG